MSGDHMHEGPSASEGHEDVLARLDALQPVGPAAPRGGAAQARRRARRRQVARGGGLAVAVAALVAVLPVVVAGDLTAAPPAVAPTVEQSAPAPVPAPSPPAPVPTDGREAVDPSPEPDPGVPTGAVTRLQIVETESEPASAGVLTDFDRPGRDTSGEGAFGGEVTWTFDPCGPTAWPGDQHRTGWWAWNTFIGDGGADYAVAVLDTEQRAADVLAGFGRAAQACWVGPDDPGDAGGPGDPGAATVWQAYPPEPAEPTVFSGAARSRAAVGDGESPVIRGVTWVGAVQQGRVVALVQLRDDFGGGTTATAQGDDRPGSGDAFPDDQTREQAQAVVAERVAAARAEAGRLAQEATEHLAGD